MDPLGLFPLLSSGNKLIIIARDYLTCSAEAKALSRGTASEVVQFFLQNIVLPRGTSLWVITKQGMARKAHRRRFPTQLHNVLKVGCLSPANKWPDREAQQHDDSHAAYVT